MSGEIAQFEQWLMSEAVRVDECKTRESLAQAISSLRAQSKKHLGDRDLTPQELEAVSKRVLFSHENTKPLAALGANNTLVYMAPKKDNQSIVERLEESRILSARRISTNPKTQNVTLDGAGSIGGLVDSIENYVPSIDITKLSSGDVGERAKVNDALTKYAGKDDKASREAHEKLSRLTTALDQSQSLSDIAQGSGKRTFDNITVVDGKLTGLTPRQACENALEGETKEELRDDLGGQSKSAGKLADQLSSLLRDPRAIKHDYAGPDGAVVDPTFLLTALSNAKTDELLKSTLNTARYVQPLIRTTEISSLAQMQELEVALTESGVGVDVTNKGQKIKNPNNPNAEIGNLEFVSPIEGLSRLAGPNEHLDKAAYKYPHECIGVNLVSISKAIMDQYPNDPKGQQKAFEEVAQATQRHASDAGRGMISLSQAGQTMFMDKMQGLSPAERQDKALEMMAESMKIPGVTQDMLMAFDKAAEKKHQELVVVKSQSQSLAAAAIEQATAPALPSSDNRKANFIASRANFDKEIGKERDAALASLAQKILDQQPPLAKSTQHTRSLASADAATPSAPETGVRSAQEGEVMDVPSALQNMQKSGAVVDKQQQEALAGVILWRQSVDQERKAINAEQSVLLDSDVRIARGLSPLLTLGEQKQLAASRQREEALDSRNRELANLESDLLNALAPETLAAGQMSKQIVRDLEVVVVDNVIQAVKTEQDRKSQLQLEAAHGQTLPGMAAQEKTMQAPPSQPHEAYNAQIAEAAKRSAEQNAALMAQRNGEREHTANMDLVRALQNPLSVINPTHDAHEKAQEQFANFTPESQAVRESLILTDKQKTTAKNIRDILTNPEASKEARAQALKDLSAARVELKDDKYQKGSKDEYAKIATEGVSLTAKEKAARIAEKISHSRLANYASSLGKQALSAVHLRSNSKSVDLVSENSLQSKQPEKSTTSRTQNL